MMGKKSFLFYCSTAMNIKRKVNTVKLHCLRLYKAYDEGLLTVPELGRLLREEVMPLEVEAAKVRAEKRSDRVNAVRELLPIYERRK